MQTDADGSFVGALPIQNQREFQRVSDAEYYAQESFFLRFRNKELESGFMLYLHRKPIAMLVFGWWAMCAVYTFLEATEDSSIGFGVNAAWYLVMATSQTCFYLCFPRFPDVQSELLFLERVTQWMTGAFATITDHRVTLLQYQSCEVFPPIAIDDRKAFDEPHCRKWFNPVGVMAAAIFLLLGVLPFTWIFSLCGLVLVIYGTMWLAIPPPDPAFQVTMMCAFAVLGTAFVAFVRRDREQGERAAFIQCCKLQEQRLELSDREKSLTKYCSMLLPRALLHRSAQAAVSLSADTNDSAAVVFIGIHDFGVWCTKRQPVEAATSVVTLELTVRKAASHRGADYIGSMGDTTVCTAGLVRSAERPGPIGCELARSVLRTGCEDSSLLRAAVHVGPLRGTFMGEYSVRYDVTGAAYRVAEEALLECPADRCVVSEGLLVAASTWFEPDADREAFSVGDQQLFHVLNTLMDSGVNSSAQVDENNKEVNTLSDEQVLVEFDAPLVSALAASTSQQHVGSVARLHEGVPREGRDPVNEAVEDVSGAAELRDELEKMQQVGTVWCCFPRFLDDELEAAFVSERMAQLPHAASRMWFAYGLFTLGVLVLLLVDFAEPNGVVGVMMLLTAIGMSVVMGTVPRVLDVVKMRKWFFAWSVTGVVLPLLVVFGCAVSRPASVGNDPLLNMVIGALVRSYCFASTRWLALAVPLTTVAGLAQYYLPGGHVRPTVFIVLGLILGIVAAEREREIVHRENTRRRVESRLVLSKLRSVERLREGLLRSAVPAEVFMLIQRYGFSCSLEGSSSSIVRDGVVMAVSASPTQRDGHMRFVACPLMRLEALLAESGSGLALSGILGDQALVVGPVVTAINRNNRQLKIRGGELAVGEALAIGVKLAEEQPDTTLSIVIDYDAIVHSVEFGDVVQYRALGVTVTRMLALLGSADPSTLAGCLLTERVASLAEELGLLRGYQTSLQGPMKFRGVGMVRFSKLTTA